MGWRVDRKIVSCTCQGSGPWGWVIRRDQAFQIVLVVKNPSANGGTQGTWVCALDSEGPLEEDMVTHSSILAWRIPRTEEPGGLQPRGSHRIRHDWATQPAWTTRRPEDSKGRGTGLAKRLKNGCLWDESGLDRLLGSCKYLKKKSLNCLNIWEHWLAPPSTGKAAAYCSSLTLTFKSPGGYHLSCKQLAEASEEVGVRRAMGLKWWATLSITSNQRNIQVVQLTFITHESMNMQDLEIRKMEQKDLELNSSPEYIRITTSCWTWPSRKTGSYQKR